MYRVYLLQASPCCIHHLGHRREEADAEKGVQDGKQGSGEVDECSGIPSGLTAGQKKENKECCGEVTEDDDKLLWETIDDTSGDRGQDDSRQNGENNACSESQG